METTILMQGNQAITSRFSSTADTVKVTAKYRSDSEVSVTVWCFDRLEQKCEGYTQKYPPMEHRDGELVFCFDPVSFSVYKGAETFQITLTADGLSVSAFVISEEHADVSLEIGDSVDPTIITENGEKGVCIMQTNGEQIIVPRIPQKVLFVGNSLVFSMFGVYGMCASAPDKDYYHYVTEHIRKFNPSCVFLKQHGAYFEHAESMEALDEWFYRNDSFSGRGAAEQLTSDVDLIFLQLGDNVNTDSKKALFQNVGGEWLIERIKERCPRARIIWIYGWYSLSRTVDTVKALSDKWGIERIDISTLHSQENEAHGQMTCLSPEGEVREVDPRWISHPGDLGMKRIADKIIARLAL